LENDTDTGTSGKSLELTLRESWMKPELARDWDINSSSKYVCVLQQEKLSNVKVKQVLLEFFSLVIIKAQKCTHNDIITLTL
jgi:hypothetical protein